jgi:hypothetical protein
MAANRFDGKNRDGFLDECSAGHVGVDQVRHFFEARGVGTMGLVGND